jgi:hypothetical protein
MTLHRMVNVRSVSEESAAFTFRVDLEVKAVSSSETLTATQSGECVCNAATTSDLIGYQEYDNTDANFVRPY